MGSLITSLFYASPYAALPPGVGNAGINLQTDPSQSPTPPTVQNPILVFRLRLAEDTSTTIGVSATSGPGTSKTSANYQPNFPLSATESYMIDIIWVPSGTPPANIDWTTAVASAPVTAATVSIQSATFDGTNLIAQVAYGPSSIGVGAQVNVWSLSGGVYVNVGSGQAQGTSVPVTVNSTGYPSVFFLSSQAVIPATNAGGAGSFSSPFSQGPPTLITNSSGIPQAAAAITSAVYDGSTLALSWSLAAVAGCVPPDSSLIQINDSNSNVIAAFRGGPMNASLPLNILGQNGISVKVSTVSNGIGSAPVSSTITTAVPKVSNVALNTTGNTVTATVTVPTTCVSCSSQAWLMAGANILAGPVTPTNNNVSFTYAAAGLVGLSVVASLTANSGIAVGPRSTPAVLLATAPTLQSATIYTNPANNTQWCIAMEWDQLPDRPEDVASYTASLNSTPATATVTGTVTTLTVAKSAVTTNPLNLLLSATGASGGQSPTQTYPASFVPPSLTALAANASQVTATWTPPSTITQLVTYQLVVASGTLVVYTGPVIFARSGAVPLEELAIPTTGNISMMVNLILGPVTLLADTSMVAGSSATPILSAAAVKPATANPSTGISTLNWNTITAASAYTVNFTDGTSYNNLTGTSYTLTKALSIGQQLGYTLQATGTSNGVPVTGPASPLAWIPTNAADVGDARFDGTNVEVEWEPIPGATGYSVSVYDNATPANQVYNKNTSGTSLSFAPTLSNTLAYTIYLQPVTAAGTGLSGDTSPLFATGIFLSQQPASTAFPYMYTAGALSDLGSAAAGPTARLLTIYLPELGAAPGALGTTPIVQDPFTIQPSGNPALPYQLTIAADATAWGFTTQAIRLNLQSNYVAFLKAIEKPTGNNPPPGITPYGIYLVQAAIAALLPQTFAEQLYYNYGLSTASGAGSGYVDLRPGMILRVMASDYIGIAQNGLPSWINGYAGGTMLDLEIGSYTAGASWLTGFDGFLSTLSAAGALTVSAPANSSASYVQAGIAAGADLYYPQFVQPFYRLFFPTSLNTPWGNGSNTTNANFTLAAAASYTSLQATSVDPTQNATAYFRGRAIVEVLIKVTVNGNERLVPVGTSLGNLLEQLGLRPAATSPLLSQIRVYRPLAAAITSTTPAASMAPTLEIRIDYNGFQSYSTGTGLNTLSLPLLAGDQIFTNS